MDLVLCHTTADFDTLGAAVGLARLQPGRRIVLTGGCHPTVQRFLALYRDEYPLIERRAVNPSHIRQIVLVDAQQRDRFGPAAEWIAEAERNQTPIAVYDHHPASTDPSHDLSASQQMVEPVGAATTLVVEAIQRAGIELTIAEATVMALGIHVDTGSLLYEGATARDAAALAWLMGHGASLPVVADFVEPGLSPVLQDLLTVAMDRVQIEAVGGHSLASVLMPVNGYVPGLSGLVERLISLTDVDALLFGAYFPSQEPAVPSPPPLSDKDSSETEPSGTELPDSEPENSIPYKLTLIGRARGRTGDRLDWGALLTALGGGGHPAAAAANLTTADPASVVQGLMAQARSQLPPQPTARNLMSSPVRTLRPDTTIAEAQRILLRYGHSGLAVVDEGDRLAGIISRRDIDLALHHGFSHAPVKGYMATQIKTITPDTPLSTLEDLMVTYDIGRLPVISGGDLVGMVTRTDLLRHRHQETARPPMPSAAVALLPAADLQHTLESCLSPDLQVVLRQIAAAAQARGWHLYLVGGAVRDLLICHDPAATLPDLDLVVDGFFKAAQAGAGVELATVIKDCLQEVDLQVHGRFQTASLVWRKDLEHPLAGLMIDIATARTEFYPYPAANPEVEASSSQQDLYRRDFTINALALRLTEPGAGQLLDYFGGLIDLRQGVIRVLHANSFIEDPTRIYRAVRFAVRLGFSLDSQTEGYIHHAMASGIYAQMQRQVRQVPALQVRLKQELKYILAAPYWQPALALLDQLQALRCLHSDLAMTPALWQQLRRLSRWVNHFPWAIGEPWLLRLEGLLATVPEEARSPLAAALQLPDRTVERLAHLDQLEHQWQTLVATQPAPSVLYATFNQADRFTLLLASARHPQTLGPAIWRHLLRWVTISPLIDGYQLQALGYKPGRAFRPMLDAVLAAQIDGTVTTKAEAEAFLAQHYPLT
jgi:tRNA nucleotidyltransferase (CCA-adding enzyme)